METKIINILSSFIHGICKLDMDYLDNIYVIHIQLCCKKLLRFEKGQFLEFWKLVSMLKIGFHGDTFAAREHNTNGMFHFSLKFCVQLMWVSKQT